MKKKHVLLILGVFFVLFIGIQFIPVPKTNPPVKSDLQASKEVKSILKRSCYDCHSNETNWPWYSNVAPVSWLVAYDVHEAREELNFSEWGNLSSQDQKEMAEEIWEEVEEGEMPFFLYTWLHPKAKLSEKEKDILKKWSNPLAGKAKEKNKHHRDDDEDDDDD